MRTSPIFSTTARIVSCAIVLLGAAGCSERDGGELLSPGPPASATSADCDGAYNCKLPNPYPCKDPADPGANRLAHRYNSEDCHFKIAANTVLYDGFGNARGTVTDAEVRINYGQRKRLPNGTVVVYVFAVGTTSGAASGWVREADVTESLAYMETVNATNPGNGDYAALWRLTGGPTPVRAFYDDMVLHNTHRPCSHLPKHYLLRPGNVVNLLYNLPGMGGVADDTYLVETGDVFRRSQGVLLRDIPFYHKDSPLNGEPFGYMQFMYGHVNGRYGWIARDAVTTDPVGTVIVDSNNSFNNTSVAQFQASTGWTFSSGTKEYYGDGYYHAPTGATSDAATFWFYLPSAQTRTVDAWWTTYANRSSTAPYIAYDANGTEVGRVSVDQKVNGGKWNRLGTWSFTAGWNRIVLSRWTTSGSYVIADAVKIR
ncbi:MAG TPA: hypothetical protein VGR37_01710 [Longimicrobiaceae bacterium]|nr:hypothetical protein [Longimicrobiaceae bacterium]